MPTKNKIYSVFFVKRENDTVVWFSRFYGSKVYTPNQKTIDCLIRMLPKPAWVVINPDQTLINYYPYRVN